MAIVKMNRFFVLAFEEDKAALLKAWQYSGNVHVRQLMPEDYEGLQNIAECAQPLRTELEKIEFSMNMLKGYADIPKGLRALTAKPDVISREDFEHYPAESVQMALYEAMKGLDDRRNAAINEKNRLTAENDGLKPWLPLDAPPGELNKLRRVKCWLGTVKKRHAGSFAQSLGQDFPNAYCEIMSAAKEEDICLIMAPADEAEAVNAGLKDIGFTQAVLSFQRLPAELIRENESRIAELDMELTQIQQAIKCRAGRYHELEIAWDHYAAALERAMAYGGFLRMGNVLAAECWTPTENRGAFIRLTSEACGGSFYYEESEAEKDSPDVPIKLKNNRVFAAFEDITAMYSLPRYNEIDPTPLLAPFYMLFFGVMVGDAGYGLLLLIGTAAALRLFHFKEGMRRFLTFFYYLSFPTILAGLVFGNAFGVTFFTPIRTAAGYKPILDAGTDIAPMLAISVGIGVVQVLFGVGVKGYMLIRGGHPWAAVFDSLTRILTLISGIALVVGMFGVSLPINGFSNAAKWVFIGSLACLALTQGREYGTPVGKLGGGLYAVYGLTGYVGDVVSYCRLIALSLAGAYIAFSFNLMAGIVPAGFLRITLGGLIIIAGQSLNMGLSLLGAYVHSCRLQYVEYFSKFYDGGGKAFNPLKIKNRHVDIKM